MELSRLKIIIKLFPVPLAFEYFILPVNLTNHCNLLHYNGNYLYTAKRNI